jgi:hypothetical protein
MQLDSLDKNKLYIIVCNDGKSSESAAFLMKTYSFKVKIIRKGLDYVPKGALLENQPLLIKNEIAKTKVLIEKTRPSLNSDSISDSKKTDNTLSHENKKLRFVLAELKLKYVKIEKENQEWEKKYNALLSQVVESKFKKKE